MEDGADNNTTVISKINESVDKENVSVLPDMANYPDIEITVIKNKNSNSDNTNTNKVNGESDGNSKDEEETEKTVGKNSSSEKEDSTDEDALVIDEEYKSKKKSVINRKRLLSPSPKGNFKGFKKRMLRKSTEVLKNVNDFIDNVQASQDICDINKKKICEGEFNVNSVKNNLEESPLSPKNKNVEEHIITKIVPDSVFNENSDTPDTIPKNVTNKKLYNNKKNPLSPKLTEYAQYLGLQPTVKFKCYKCSESSFPTMIALNEHQQQCLAQPVIKENQVLNQTTNPTSTNFRVTRKVYLCSACGTYYENWNLFLHMREVHRRFICLYCLGMFSLVEKLTQHLITKHNCSPTSHNSTEDYLNSHKDSSFLMCCHCETIFTEQDNFYEHVCSERTTYTDKTCWSCGVKGTNPHLTHCKASIEQPKTKKRSEETHNTIETLNFYTEPSTSSNNKLKSKNKKVVKKSSVNNINHVTADSHNNTKVTEKTCDIANLCTIDMDTIKTEPDTPDKSPHDDNQPDPTQDNQMETENTNTEPQNSSNNLEPSLKSPSNESEPCDRDEEIDEENAKNNEDKSNLDSSKEESCDIPTEELNNKNDSIEEKNNQTIGTMETSFDSEKNNETSLESVDFSDDIDDNKMQNVTETYDMEITKISPNLEEMNTEKRCVPKITLKLPPNSIRQRNFSDHESSDSDKLTMEVDNMTDENEDENEELDESQQINGKDHDDDDEDELLDNFELENDLQIAGEDIPVSELELSQPLDKFDTEDLLKTCLKATIPMCLYCNHARKIAVNGKGLGLHAITEHRFSATVNSITAEELIPNNFVVRIKSGLRDVEDKFFNLEAPQGSEIPEQSLDVFKREYECFQCRYVTTIHKELYLHNRKMHAKTILLCIMCKSNFYSYSELICHLCPGMYVLNSEMKFRCCMCTIPDLPSAFRLMVHLRKRHHTCDVCLEGCQNQSRLSNHVWKHKLHHLCYRCGIAYRNKPDITKHLFWKHGTESVLCKKCLQKKWPHVYHFCIPPTAFICEECNLTFSRAVYLKVHKRLHTNDKKHHCTEENCTEAFISKKLLLKHEKRHRDPSPIPEKPIELVVNGENLKAEKIESLEKEINNPAEENVVKEEEVNPEEKDDPNKKSLIDVYDLPALNLSESDSSDSEDEKPKSKHESQEEEPIKPAMESPKENMEEVLPEIEPLQTSVENIDENVEEQKLEVDIGIWDNFKQYQATIEKRDSFNIERDEDKPKEEEIQKEDEEKVEKTEEKNEPIIKEPLSEVQQEILPDLEVIMVDHDYCAQSAEKGETTEKDLNKPVEEIEEKESTKVVKEKKKASSSSDSSDSDSSSCTCGSNCSCSSSSGSSSSSSSSSDSDSSSSEGKRRIAARKERRKERAKRKKSETSQAASNNSIDIMQTEESKVPIIELPIEESDLETDETETDEDFYDEYPQRLANKMLEEKRNQLLLLAGVTPSITNGSIVENSRPSTPSIPEEVITNRSQPKKKSKSKKRKKKSRISTPKRETQIIAYQNHQPNPMVQQVPPPQIPQIVPQIVQKSAETVTKISVSGSGSETDSNLRMSKRRRVPNKFYGYSSDEEGSEKPPAPPILKWRKADLPTPQPKTEAPKTVPPITIKNIPSPAPIIEPKVAPMTIVHHRMKDSDSENEIQNKKSSNSDSSEDQNDDSDSDGQLHITNVPQPHQIPQYPTPIQRNENLYCYCQCPYDEVSEMIACDGRDCEIEWFHFECVGIMVPPKGKWYCPDCRKKAAMKSDYIQT